ncbi:MAG TPA: DUF4326 domain-containing protein [Brevefilum fermentans]|jgi:hypothetical protein|nr:DUF4326 domain-containing protein [Brevefilum fermentans]
MIEIINYKNCKDFDEYGGRSTQDPRSLPVGAFGWLGNPFQIGRDGDRNRCIQQYKTYFWKRINSDQDFLRGVLALDGKKVACFCSPLACHLDVINQWFSAGCPLTNAPINQIEKGADHGIC